MSKITQEARVLEYMKDFGSITSYEAFSELGATRLSAIIFNLQRKGHRIASQYIKRENRWGEPVKFKKYWISEDEA